MRAAAVLLGAISFSGISRLTGLLGLGAVSILPLVGCVGLDIEKIVAERDAKARQNIGEKRYLTTYSVLKFCQDRELKQQCKFLTSGHVTVIDYPAISSSELPIYQVRLNSGEEGFIPGGICAHFAPSKSKRNSPPRSPPRPPNASVGAASILA